MNFTREEFEEKKKIFERRILGLFNERARYTLKNEPQEKIDRVTGGSQGADYVVYDLEKISLEECISKWKKDLKTGVWKNKCPGASEAYQEGFENEIKDALKVFKSEG